MLFLFQIYKVSDGVKKCCDLLDMKQELLNYYIQQDDKDMVLKVCVEYQQTPNHNPSMARDLWVQALTYFRDLPPLEDSKYLVKALNQFS